MIERIVKIVKTHVLANEKVGTISIFNDASTINHKKLGQFELSLALQETCLFVPIVTESCLKKLSTLKEGSTCEYLTNWETALRLSESSQVCIIPLFIGNKKTDSLSSSSSSTSSIESTYQQFSGFTTIMPDICTASSIEYAKKLSEVRGELVMPLNVKTIVYNVLKFSGVFVDPSNLEGKIEALVNRFSQEIWPVFRQFWKNKEEIGPEPILTCVQCDQKYTWSQNKDGVCAFHRGFVR
ncbi:hypothetical protein HK098_001908, partial [Nowakowskiella sp. JEL0407]